MDSSSDILQFPIAAERTRREHRTGTLVVRKRFCLRIPLQFAALVDRDQGEMAKRIAPDGTFDAANGRAAVADGVEEIAAVGGFTAH